MRNLIPLHTNAIASTIGSAFLALCLLQVPQMAQAKAAHKGKEKAAHVQGKGKAGKAEKAEKTAHKGKATKASKAEAKLSTKHAKHGKKQLAEKAPVRSSKADLSEDAREELSATRARISSASQDRQAQMREVRRAQLALAGFSPSGAGDEDEAYAPNLDSSNAVSWGKRSGLQYAADPLGLSASVGYLMDANTGEVLYSKNENAVLPIASITKLMTAVVIAEASLPMDEAITISEDDVDHLKNSSSRLKVGTTLSRGQMLLLALMSSENRAAHSLARTYPGGTYNFVRYMNQKARDLGMKSTRYADPTGLSSENQSSAHDLAILASHAAKDATLRSYSTSQEYAVDSVDGRSLTYRNSNALVRGGTWPVELQKTGYIREAGRCMVVQSQMAGRSTVMVLLDATTSAERRGDAERIRQWVEGGSSGLYAAGSTTANPSNGGGFVQAASTGNATGGNIMRALRSGY
jgi:D-alanyl-D-alanine endopeptidase (penicillin-binding protein 7)